MSIQPSLCFGPRASALRRVRFVAAATMPLALAACQTTGPGTPGLLPSPNQTAAAATLKANPAQPFAELAGSQGQPLLQARGLGMAPGQFYETLNAATVAFPSDFWMAAELPVPLVAGPTS